MARIEATVVARLSAWALRRAGFHDVGEYITREHDAIDGTCPSPAVVEMDRDGTRVRVEILGLGPTPKTIRLAAETDDAGVAQEIERVLNSFHPSQDPEEREKRERQEVLARVNRHIDKALSAIGATREQLDSGKIGLTAPIAGSIMAVYPSIWDPAIRDSLLLTLAPRKLPKDLKLLVARWMIEQWGMTKERDIRWRIGDCLSRVACPEIAEDLMRLLSDRLGGTSRQMLCGAIVSTKHPRAGEALAAVLDDDSVAGHAIAALGRLKDRSSAARVQPFLKHAHGWVRREAKKTLERMGETVENAPSPVHLFKGVPDSGLEEWSTNLDMDDLEPWLVKLSSLVEAGFGKTEIAEVVGVAERMRIDATQTFRFAVRFGGREQGLFVQVFMDDEESPDLAIHGSKPLIEAFVAVVS